LVVLVKLTLLAKCLARKTLLRKPNCGEGIISIKPRPKRAYSIQFNLFASDHMDPYHNKRKYNEMIK